MHGLQLLQLHQKVCTTLVALVVLLADTGLEACWSWACNKCVACSIFMNTFHIALYSDFANMETAFNTYNTQNKVLEVTHMHIIASIHTNISHH